MAEILLTINMRKYLVKQERNKRLRRAAGYVRNRIAHYTKTQPENVVITQELNNAIVKRYYRSMLPLKLSIKLEGGKATASQFQEAKTAKPVNQKGKEFQKIYNRLAPKKKVATQKDARAEKDVKKNVNNTLPHKEQ